MLRAVIIGCGAIAQVHKEALLKLDNAKLVACCDIKPERAELFAKDTGIKYYFDAKQMLEEVRPDVAHICVPHPLHTPMAKLCAEYKVHVFTEKPPAVDEKQWEEFESLKGSEIRVGVCFQNRYNQAVVKAKRLIGEGTVGSVLGARAFLTWSRDRAYYEESDWRGSWSTEGGGVLINQAIHTLDLLVWLLGTPKNVSCHMSNHSLQDVIEVEDTLEADIHFASGINAIFYATNAYCSNAPVLIEIVCSEATLRLEGDDLTVTKKGGGIESFSSLDAPFAGKVYWGSSHSDCIEDFYCCVEEGRNYQNDIDSVKDTMQIMLAMYKDYRGKRIGNN